MIELLNGYEGTHYPDLINIIMNYNEEMTISQVVLFFQRINMNVTKTMIQNYVRVNVLPPPVDKRYYNKKHLILICMIDGLKSIYSLEEIKLAFNPVFKNEDSFDETVDMYLFFKLYKSFYDNYMDNFSSNLSELKAEFANILRTNNLNEQSKISKMLPFVYLMAECYANKKIFNTILESIKETE